MERLILLPMLSEEKCNTSVVDDSPTLLCRQTGCCAQPGISWLLSVLFSCLDGFFFNLLQYEGHFHRLDNIKEFGHQED